MKILIFLILSACAKESTSTSTSAALSPACSGKTGIQVQAKVVSACESNAQVNWSDQTITIASNGDFVSQYDLVIGDATILLDDCTITLKDGVPSISTITTYPKLNCN